MKPLTKAQKLILFAVASGMVGHKVVSNGRRARMCVGPYSIGREYATLRKRRLVKWSALGRAELTTAGLEMLT